ncbi:hypothetical protein FOZ63_025953 [Perkinsus olseni]|uniref:ENTH domain-containing protein n=1 Tax=Perkinsus olseni TaxID=32597 RepID=A0A7J6PV05_PEROL|nr:hypothetical protein FOZ63_025953 [Perkinsus olseni]
MPTGATRPSRGFSDTVADILRPVARVISTADKADINSDAEETAEVVRRLISCEDHMGFLEGIGSLKMKDDLEKICRASYEGRRSREAMMEQLAWGLSRSASWRESYSSLLVLEALALTGSQELWKECSVGTHFDVTQRLVLFGHFTSKEDPRVTRMIRAKASEVRDLVTDRYRAAEESIRKYGSPRLIPAPKRNGFYRGGASPASSSSSSSVSESSPVGARTRKGYSSLPVSSAVRPHRNGIAAVASNGGPSIASKQLKDGFIQGFARPAFTIDTSESEGSCSPASSRPGRSADLLDIRSHNEMAKCPAGTPPSSHTCSSATTTTTSAAPSSGSLVDLL